MILIANTENPTNLVLLVVEERGCKVKVLENDTFFVLAGLDEAFSLGFMLKTPLSCARIS